MITDPLGTALKQITETKDILQRLLVSSESFDYPQAKTALKKLERKVRDLTKLEAKFRGGSGNTPEIYVLDFKTGKQVSAGNF